MEHSAQLLEEKREEKKAGEGDFSLDEVMDDGYFQNESSARGKRTPDLPLPAKGSAHGSQIDGMKISSVPITLELISKYTGSVFISEPHMTV